MNKWHGKIGFIKTVETVPDVYEEQVAEKLYRGDVIRNSSKWSQKQDSTNNDLNISNSISIIADPYLNNNIQSIRYIEFMGGLWDVTSIDVQFPRLVLSIGGVYNGKTD